METETVEMLDRYLLTGQGDKATLVQALLRHRSPQDGAAPFYRALESVGERTPDDALIALRIAIAGRRPDDARVLAVRSLVAAARNAQSDARAFDAIRTSYGKELKA